MKGMKTLRLSLLSFVLGFLALNPISASGHSVTDYPSFGWKYTVLSRVFYTHPTKWPSTFNTRTDAAMAAWNALAGSNLGISRGGTAPSNSWACGSSYDVLTRLSLGNAYAATSVCSPANSTTRIAVNNGTYTYYTGTSTPNPSTQVDLQGIISQEFGHAQQAWNFCTDGGSGDPCAGEHYDTTYNAAICDIVNAPALYSTMCATISIAESWRERTLEVHDVDLIEALY